MKHNKTHKRNKNNKKLNSKSEKTKKRKTSNKTTGGEDKKSANSEKDISNSAFPRVKVISKFIKKDPEDKADVNRFDVNIRSYYELDDYLYQVEDFLKRFELDLLSYTDKTEYNDVITKQNGRTDTKEHKFTIEKKS